MSNVIKAYSVRYDHEVTKTIDIHQREQKVMESQRKILLGTDPAPSDGFVEGLQTKVVEVLPTEEEIREQNVRTLEAAQKEAALILEQAKIEAEQIKKEAYTVAQKKGYDDGKLQAMKEAQRLKAEYEQKEQELQKQYAAMIETLEPQMADLISELITKITGILVKDKEEVILYLIERAINNIDKSGEYTVKVSKEDFPYVSEHENEIRDAIGREVLLFIKEDSHLDRNQCLIETELKVLNCSLDVQLNNLITDLKLISNT